MKYCFVAILFSVVCAPGALAAELADFRLPSPQIETLPNGMKVAWFLDDKLPLVDLALMVESGTKNDPRGKSGTVELLSRLLERGSNGHTAQEIAERVESLGASGFASSDEEGITVGMHGLSQDADSLLETLAWMALKPSLLPNEYQREIGRIVESWQHLPDSVDTLSGYAFGRAILSGTAYGRGSLQDLKELRKVSLADVKTFHRLHFVPKNAIFMVVGRVNQNEFRKKILEHFGSWSGDVPKKITYAFRDPRLSLDLSKKVAIEKRDILVIDRPGMPQAQVRIGFRIPGIRSKSRYSLQVANALLGEYFNSRLNLIVRDRLGLAYGIQSSLTYFKEMAFFSIASATASASTGKLIEETVRQLRLVKAGDLLNEEVDVSKEYLLGGYPLSVSTLGAVANRWLNGYAFDLGPDYMNEFMPKISAVTRDSVVSAVEESFHLDRMVIVIAGDAKAIEKSLRTKGFKRFRRIAAKSLL